MATWLELTDEPMVIETPPNGPGIIDDHRFKFVADFGRLGPDKAQGGKFPILLPGYEGEVPDGYSEVVSWASCPLIWRYSQCLICF
jgi:hypothetical protein